MSPINECAKCNIITVLIKTIEDKDKTIKALEESLKIKNQIEIKYLLLSHNINLN
jgi:hypothetical protein